MLPGLIESPRPVSASSDLGMAQKAPGSRGKNTNSMTASGKANSRLRLASSMAARLSKLAAEGIAEERSVGAYATTANAAQHSHACNR
jgi:hypothetical protein